MKILENRDQKRQFEQELRARRRITNSNELINRDDRLGPWKRRDTDSRDEDCKLINEKRGKTETLKIRRETVRGERDRREQRHRNSKWRRKKTETETLKVQKTDCEPGKRKRTIKKRR
jgi:hypothetical protein